MTTGVFKTFGAGFTLNIPMWPGSGDADYRRAYEEKFLPAAESFKPQFVLVSAGFDAHRSDPLAPMDLDTESYEWLSRETLSLANRYCDGKLVSVLEGGYDLRALSDSVVTHLCCLLET